MAKQKIEVEVDIPKGCEVVRCESTDGTPDLQFGESYNTYRVDGRIWFVIYRPSWQWPEWLTAEWIARDADGEWWAFNQKPRASCGSWISEGGRYFLLSKKLVAFTPPPCTDWRQSLRRNPNHRDRQPTDD